MLERDSPAEEMPREKLELKLFRQSPLGTRISEEIQDPITTREILLRKKSQAYRITKEKARLKDAVNKTYNHEIESHPSRTVRMPLVRIFNSKSKKKPEDSNHSDPGNSPELIDFTFPDICEVFWSKQENNGWKPETRQQATLTAVNNKLYLIGGVSKRINSEINLYLPAYKRWERLDSTGAESEPRFGHSAVDFKGKIVIFGGGTDFNNVHKLRECLNGVKTLNTETKEIANLKCGGSYINTRKQHCYALVGKHMFIQGGMNQKNNLLDDAALLNLKKNYWQILNVKGSGPGFCALHSAALVLGNEQKGVKNIFKIPVTRKKYLNSGIYVFGGLNEGKIATNSLFLLKIGMKHLMWTTPETVGQPPSPRFSHSMNFNEKLDVVVIFGGRVDTVNTNHYTCFNDVFLLRVKDLTWVTVKVLGNVPPPRSGHSTASYGSKVFMFGGITNAAYCSSHLYVLEINPKSARQLIEEEERRKARELEIEILKAKRVEFS
jgi:N-acetylneuraminic acid mutarotase